jgi:hypothetical protein
MGVAVVTPMCGIENGRVIEGWPVARGVGRGDPVVGWDVEAAAVAGVAFGFAAELEPAIAGAATGSMGTAGAGAPSQPPTAAAARTSATTGRRPTRITRDKCAT